MSVTQNIPARYDPRVEVKPCDPARVPYLPLQILYLIASALPQPKSVFDLALASKETWEYLQPALFECEVTFESRLAGKYGGRSSDSLQQHYAKYLKGSDSDDGIEETGTTSSEGSDQALQASDKGCHHGKPHEQCDECGERIRLDDRTFDSPEPTDMLFTDRRLTALHWACTKGPSALPVALKAIRAAVAHQPSYINGVGLRERLYHPSFRYETHEDERIILADLPPPLFFAVAHGNVEACRALVEAGCNVNLLQGQEECGYWTTDDEWVRLMSFKVHKECARSRGCPVGWPDDDPETQVLSCVCQWVDDDCLYEAPGCQTAGHIAIQYDKSEILEILLRGGLDVEQGLVPLLNYAVFQGNVAAVKLLLEYDPSLLHRRKWGRPLIEAVVFIEPRPEDDHITQLRRVKGMIEYLVTKGANVDSRADRIEDEEIRTGHSEMTALQTTLEQARTYVDSAPQAVDHLIAAEIFICMGANWNQPIYATTQSEGLLESAVVRTAGIFTDMWDLDENETAQALENRKGWGRVVKAMIETGSQLPAGNGTNLLEVFSSAFTFFVNFHEPENGPNRFGPWGAEAVGKLLLSTGITPSDADMEKWKTLCLNREEWTSQDGDPSDWAFLLADIDTNEPETE